MRFRHETAALAMRKRTKFLEGPRRKKHGRARHTIETRAPNLPDGIVITINPSKATLRAGSASCTIFWKTRLRNAKRCKAPFPGAPFRKGLFHERAIYGVALEKSMFREHALREASFCGIKPRTSSIAQHDIGSIAPYSVAPRGICSAALSNICNAVLHTIAPHGTSSTAPHGIAFRGTKKRGDAGRANKRLVALDERDRIAPVHGLHAQSHRVVSARLFMQNRLRAQRFAQRSHIGMARNHHTLVE